MCKTAVLCRQVKGVESLWASARELLNIIQAQDCGVDIITVTNDILSKMRYIGKDLTQFSLETVQMFRNDAMSLGYKIPPTVALLLIITLFMSCFFYLERDASFDLFSEAGVVSMINIAKYNIDNEGIKYGIRLMFEAGHEQHPGIHNICGW